MNWDESLDASVGAHATVQPLLLCPPSPIFPRDRSRSFPGPPLVMHRPLLSAVVTLVLIAAAPGCANSSRSPSTPSGLAYTVVAEGTGPVATPGQHVSVHETVTFTDGRALYSTRGGSPVRFLLGGGQVIAGVDDVVAGMRAGERRVAVIPPRLSQRDSYPEGLSPDDSLHYDIELVGIEAP